MTEREVDGGDRHPARWRPPVLFGAGLGLAWGGAMRMWMRYISTDPEFSWAGTLFILVAATAAGALLGLARHRRRLGGVGWWRLTFLSLFLLGAGGAVMWPAVVLGSLAWGWRGRRWVRVMLGVAALASQVPVIDESVLANGRLGSGEMLWAVVWYLPMLAFDAWAFSVAFAPAVVNAPRPGRVTRVAIAVPVAVMVVLGLAVMALPGM